MYIEHPYNFDGKFYAKVDGKFIEITKEVAYAMNNFYRSSQPKRFEVTNENGEIEKKLREVPYSVTTEDGSEFTIEECPDMNCDVEEKAINLMEHQEVHSMIHRLDEEERMIIYAIYFENKTQMELAKIMGISQQMLAYKLKRILNKMRGMYLNEKNF
jgi:RNA polymerase sigma factor (sigma-70 family)